MSEPLLDPRAMAGVDLLRRTGAKQFQVRYSDDEEPVVWIAASSWQGKNPLTGKDRERWEVAGGLDPTVAIMRLCEQVIDGGQCQHCGKPTIFQPLPETDGLEVLGCVYAFDPELATFRRGCEGDQ